MEKTKAFVAGLGALLVLASVVAVVSHAQNASATFPGTNGRIVFTSNRDGGDYEIYAMNADGSKQTRLTHSPGFDFRASWSPDGTKIVFESERDGNYEIYVMNWDGSNQTNLTNNPTRDFGAAWSPDGKKIAFTSIRDGSWGIFVMNADGSGQTNITNSTSFLDIRASWSPDGNKIAFHSSRSGFHGIFVMNSDGSGVMQVADFGTIDAAPSWSPDGTRILYDSNVSDPDFGNEEIVMVNSDGTGAKTNLSNNPAHDVEPDWGTNTSLPQQFSLTVASVDAQGNPVDGLWTVIRGADGAIVKSGYTPLTFTGQAWAEYKVTVANYDGKVFTRWQDSGDTSNTRTVELSSDTVLNAVYDLGGSSRGFTPLTYPGFEERPELTVDAKSLDGETLHMYMIIDPQSAGPSGGTYKVYAGNYKDIVFDHWSDGSTDRIRSLTITEKTTLTAYYRIG